MKNANVYDLTNGAEQLAQRVKAAVTFLNNGQSQDALDVLVTGSFTGNHRQTDEISEALRQAASMVNRGAKKEALVLYFGKVLVVKESEKNYCCQCDGFWNGMCNREAPPARYRETVLALDEACPAFRRKKGT